MSQSGNIQANFEEEHDTQHSQALWLLVQEKTIRPQVKALEQVVNELDLDGILLQLSNIRQMLLYSIEFVPETVSHPSNNVCGIGLILSKLLKGSNVNASILTSSCRCIVELCKYPQAVLKDLTDNGVLESLVDLLVNAQDFESIEATIEALCNLAPLFPHLCLKANVFSGLLHNYGFLGNQMRTVALRALEIVSKVVATGDFVEFIQPNLSVLLEIFSVATEASQLYLLVKIWLNLSVNDTITSVSDQVFIPLRKILSDYENDLKLWIVAFNFGCKNCRNQSTFNFMLSCAIHQLKKQLETISIVDRFDLLLETVLRNIISFLLRSPDILRFLTFPLSPEGNHMNIVLERNFTIRIAYEKDSEFFLVPKTMLGLFGVFDVILLKFPCTSTSKLMIFLCIFAILVDLGPDCEILREEPQLLRNILMSYCTIDRSERLSLIYFCNICILLKKHANMMNILGSSLSFREGSLWPTNITEDSKTNAVLEDILALYHHPDVSDHDQPTLWLLLENSLVTTFPNVLITDSSSQGLDLLPLYFSEDSNQKELILHIERAYRFISSELDHVMHYPTANNWSMDSIKDLSLKICVTGIAIDNNGAKIPLNFTSILSNQSTTFGAIVYRFLNGDEQDVTVDNISEDFKYRHFIKWNKHCCKVKIPEGPEIEINPEQCITAYFSQLSRIEGSTPIQTIANTTIFMRENTSLQFKISLRDDSGHSHSSNSPLMTIPPHSVEDILDSARIIIESNRFDQNLSSVMVNPKLSFYLSRTLQSIPMIAADMLPDLSHYFMRLYPFLFYFDAKVDYLFAYSMPFTRYLARMNTKRADEVPISDSAKSRLKVKFCVDRTKIVNSAQRIFSKVAEDRNVILEFYFMGDVGLGLGPTLEFYASVSELTARNDKLWIENRQFGLYPGPKADPQEFSFIGFLVARTILDSRLLDLPLNEVFVDALLGRSLPLSLRTLTLVDPQLSQTLRNLQDAPPSAFEGLYFVHPSFPSIELCSGGETKKVAFHNFIEFRDSLLKFILETSIQKPIIAFRESFNRVLSLGKFSILSAAEFNTLINGASSVGWSADEIVRSMKTDHGYSKDDPQIKWLAEVFSELSLANRKNLLRFMTGASNLPSGGWTKLDPPFTVVHRQDPRPDSALPSVMTCANYLKLPHYSSKEVLKVQLLRAIKEGQGNFLLS